ncbi:hypothetical protein F7Q99_36745 [Streptomyces kaniharaensis]|uniref:Uncharacterized protein n=1 Tax=Streptomyces kaniharaensis TaxID=212423 RepID=A0A6N7L1G8_9ACTN|nr:hypothetical protein [Streptomyces kaniharaensis]MQS17590.1 hypothetical protein [Streptomyces kaniharaensis]
MADTPHDLSLTDLDYAATRRDLADYLLHQALIWDAAPHDRLERKVSAADRRALAPVDRALWPPART